MIEAVTGLIIDVSSIIILPRSGRARGV